ncbi:MAG: acyl-CoA dehydrogenase [Clostridia bacterium]|nr:acyl-CoA dehydrogenase [Clostridia bacterium]
MNFNLTKEQEMVRTMVNSFAENEVEPIAADIDLTGEFPHETVKKMSRYGILGIPFPEEYGGAGGDYVSYAITVEELSRKCASTGVICSAHTSLCGIPIYLFGTEEQKQKYLTPLAKGEKLGAFGLTEPDAGTDAAGQKTTARLEGDEYILNGTKVFITNGGVADTYIVIAVTDRSKGTHKGTSAFIVEADTPGFTIGKKEDKMGIRASATTELIFEDCKIPKENLLGNIGEGFKIAMTTLDSGRIGIAAQALGIAQAALDNSTQYSKERVQFGRPISKFQAIQWQLADMATEVEAARMLVYKAAYLKDTKQPFSSAAAMAKLFAAEAAMKASTKAVQIHGGYGYMKDYPVERLMRDAKITEIYEGTSEVQRMVIASKLLK